MEEKQPGRRKSNPSHLQGEPALTRAPFGPQGRWGAGVGRGRQRALQGPPLGGPGGAGRVGPKPPGLGPLPPPPDHRVDGKYLSVCHCHPPPFF